MAKVESTVGHMSASKRGHMGHEADQGSKAVSVLTHEETPAGGLKLWPRPWSGVRCNIPRRPAPMLRVLVP